MSTSAPNHDAQSPSARPTAMWGALLVALCLAGCVGPRPATGQSAASQDAGDAWARAVEPFEVRAADGEPYDLPFLGGLAVPRPQLVDIDGDGDLDLFVQEDTGRVTFFENTGTAEATRFTWQTDKYAGLDVGEWYRFNDLDNDGDADLLAETPYSYIRYYRNTGSPTNPAFELATDTLRDVSGEPIFSDRQNIPNVNDIDCDGQPDLFLGRLDGTITRYEQAGNDDDGVPQFELVTERFEDIEIVAQISVPGGGPATTPQPNVPQNRDGPSIDDVLPGGAGSSGNSNGPGRPTLHGANTMAFADVDDDGDYDLLWGDYFEPGLLLIENTGSCARPDLRNEPQPFPPPDPLVTSGYNAPTVGDLSGDGRLDLVVGVIGGAFDPSRTARENLYYYTQRADGGYTLQTRRLLLGIDVGSESAPALGDLDGDGDLDLLVANKLASDGSRTADLVRFEHAGTPEAPALVLRDTLAAADGYNYAPALGDLDDDNDLDLLVGTWNDGVAHYHNDGTGAFVLADTVLVDLDRGSHATPTLGDLDGDGDLDLVVGETTGTLNLFRNEGTPQAPQFEPVTDEYMGIDVGRRSAPTLVDLDEDGDLDLVVGTENDGLLFFRNEGTPQEARFGDAPDATVALPEGVQPLPSPAFGDLDGDGALDLVLGGLRGGVTLFLRRTPVTQE